MHSIAGLRDMGVTLLTLPIFTGPNRPSGIAHSETKRTPKCKPHLLSPFRGKTNGLSLDRITKCNNSHVLLIHNNAHRSRKIYTATIGDSSPGTYLSKSENFVAIGGGVVTG